MLITKISVGEGSRLVLVWSYLLMFRITAHEVLFQGVAPFGSGKGSFHIFSGAFDFLYRNFYYYLLKWHLKADL